MFGVFGKKARSEVGSVTGFGKLPALGDFVRTSSPSDELIAFEAWLTRAMETGEARRGFREGFESGPPHAFVWSGTIEKKLRGVFAGVILPSHDAVGRRFPIVIGAPLPVAALGSQPHTTPLILYDFFHQAAGTAARTRMLSSAAEFQAQVQSIAAPSLDDAEASRARYESYASTRLATDAATGLYTEPEPGLRHAVGTIVEATRSYRGQDSPPLTLGCRVPIGRDRRADLAMWLDLTRRAAGWKAMVPSMFFPLAGGHALIQLGGEAPPSVLADLFAPSPDSAAVCDLTTSDGAPPPPSLTVLTESTTLADLAAALAE